MNENCVMIRSVRKRIDDTSKSHRQNPHRPSHGPTGARPARAHRGTPAPVPALRHRRRRERFQTRRRLVSLRTVRPDRRGRRPPDRDRTPAREGLLGLPDRNRASAPPRPHVRRTLQKRAGADPRSDRRQTNRRHTMTTPAARRISKRSTPSPTRSTSSSSRSPAWRTTPRWTSPTPPPSSSAELDAALATSARCCARRDVTSSSTELTSPPLAR